MRRCSRTPMWWSVRWPRRTPAHTIAYGTAAVNSTASSAQPTPVRSEGAPVSAKATTIAAATTGGANVSVTARANRWSASTAALSAVIPQHLPSLERFTAHPVPIDDASTPYRRVPDPVSKSLPGCAGPRRRHLAPGAAIRRRA